MQAADEYRKNHPTEFVAGVSKSKGLVDFARVETTADEKTRSAAEGKTADGGEELIDDRMKIKAGRIKKLLL